MGGRSVLTRSVADVPRTRPSAVFLVSVGSRREGRGCGVASVVGDGDGEEGPRLGSGRWRRVNKSRPAAADRERAANARRNGVEG
jgi:hypothetical protein